MTKSDKLLNELPAWDRFLLFLEKIKPRTSKIKENKPYKQEEVRE